MLFWSYVCPRFRMTGMAVLFEHYSYYVYRARAT